MTAMPSMPSPLTSTILEDSKMPKSPHKTSVNLNGVIGVLLARQSHSASNQRAV